MPNLVFSTSFPLPFSPLTTFVLVTPLPFASPCLFYQAPSFFFFFDVFSFIYKPFFF